MQQKVSAQMEKETSGNVSCDMIQGVSCIFYEDQLSFLIFSMTEQQHSRSKFDKDDLQELLKESKSDSVSSPEAIHKWSTYEIYAEQRNFSLNTFQ